MTGHVYERCKPPVWAGAPWNRHRLWVCDCGKRFRVRWIQAMGDGMWVWETDRA